jgi:hypothetical protein
VHTFFLPAHIAWFGNPGYCDTYIAQTTGLLYVLPLAIS